MPAFIYHLCFRRAQVYATVHYPKITDKNLQRTVPVFIIIYVRRNVLKQLFIIQGTAEDNKKWTDCGSRLHMYIENC